MKAAAANGLRMEEVEPGLWSVEASSLEFPAGWANWPTTITLTLAARGMEPEMPLELSLLGFQHEQPGDRRSDVVSATYESRLGGHHLLVLND